MNDQQPEQANESHEKFDAQGNTQSNDAASSEAAPSLATPSSTPEVADAMSPRLEGQIWQGRTDWRYHAGVCAVSALAVLVACVTVIYAASKTSLSGGWAFLICVMIFAMAAIGVGAWIFIQIVKTRYRLTDQRLFIERGVFSQTIDQIELIRVDDVRLRKKFVDRLLGLGSVELLTTDTSDSHLIIEGIRNPEEIAEHVRTRMRELRSRSLFIENL